MKKWLWLLLAVGIAVVGYGLFCVAFDWYENYRRTLPERREAQRQAYLNQTVRGYATEDGVAQASFQATSVEYFGGHMREVQYTQGELIYRERPAMQPEAVPQEMPVKMTEERRELLMDIFNLICKQELWTQGDELPPNPVCDGGEVAYRFTVAGHQGQFKVVNTDPKHLEVFRHKCWQLLESCQSRGRPAAKP